MLVRVRDAPRAKGGRSRGTKHARMLLGAAVAAARGVEEPEWLEACRLDDDAAKAGATPAAPAEALFLDSFGREPARFGRAPPTRVGGTQTQKMMTSEPTRVPRGS